MLSKYSSKNTIPKPTIIPKIKAIAIFIVLFGATGFFGSTFSRIFTFPLIGTNSSALVINSFVMLSKIFFTILGLLL